jgi:hypothetical protein
MPLTDPTLTVKATQVITLNDGSILFKSSKQKITTLSSSESELVCLSESVPSICGILDFLNDMRAKVTSKIIFQDNLSTIQMIKNARPTSQRTKHITLDTSQFGSASKDTTSRSIISQPLQ